MMAFVLTVDEDDTELTLLVNETEANARICVGYDDETGATYSVWVALFSRMGREDEREVHFSVIEADPDDDAPENWCMDGLETKRFLSHEHRKVALSCICTCLQELVRQVQPETIYMMTVTPSLPKKALRKYDEVCQSVHQMGYQTGRDSPFHGTEIWLMKRVFEGT